MVNAQEWLEKKYPHKKEIKVIEREEEISDELIIADFPQLEGIYVSGKHNKKKLTQLHLNNCSQLTELNCGYNKLTKLTITNCPNLQKIDAWNNQLTNLDLKTNIVLTHLSLSNNKLIHLDLSNNQQLEWLSINKNNFSSDLSFLSHLVNLRRLYLSNNNFTGSLEPLRNLQKLEYLSISSTDLSQGLEYLFDNIKNLYCSIADRPTSKVKAIEQELRKCGVPSRNANNFANPLTAWRKINPDKIKIAQRTREIEQLEKQLKEAHVQLIQQTQQIEKLIDDLTVEREVNQESAEAMDRFYRQNPPSGSISLKNILDEVSVDYLAISRENKRQKKEIQELKDKWYSTEKIIEAEEVAKSQEQLKQLKTQKTKLRDRLLAYISNNERRQIQTELKRVDNQIESIQQKPAKTIISNSNPNPTQIINHVHNVHSN